LKGYDPKLLPIFAAEQAEHAGRIRATAEALVGAAPEARAPLFDELLRRAHTLKGAARAVGIEPTERLSHAVEALFGRIRAEGAAVSAADLGALRRAVDAAEDVLAAALAGREPPPISRALAALDNPSAPAPAETPPHPEPARAEPPAPVDAAGLVRVSAERIDAVIRATAQLRSVTAGAAQGARRAAEARELARRLDDAWRQFRRVAAAYAAVRREDIEFAPVLESMDTVEDGMRAVSAHAAASATLADRHTWELDERVAELDSDARRVRMITADALYGAFGAMVRDLARDEGKQVDFRAEGLDVQADRLVLQGLKDSVMHLLRNAVTHGVEAPAERQAAGKAPAGAVALRLRARGDRLEIAVEDDGRGLDLAGIAATAKAKGLLPADAGPLTPADAARLIVRPGFSTAAHVTPLAGRGMGLSVVREAARGLGGDLAVTPARRAGVRIEISVPLSISTQRVLLLEAAGHVLGLPSAAVERLWRGPASDVKTIEGREAIDSGGAPVTLARLETLLELAPRANAPRQEEQPAQKLNVAVLSSRGERAGIVVDRFLDDRDATVKSLGVPPSLAGISAGGVLLDDGGIAVILDPAALVERFRASGVSPAVAAPAPEARPKARILVVDDSLTTRSLEKSILEAHGYDVRVAVDGMQALEELRASGADLVITDVMMPRMDGLELLGRIKADKALAAIPVIMVTSLERREDQERGLSLGADAYIVKRKFDQRELLKTVRQIL
jgi:two-component system, chemotaxis family, sensor kinase CheA